MDGGQSLPVVLCSPNLEGLAGGPAASAAIADRPVPRPRRWAFASRGAAFAVTTPAGVVLGLAIRRSYSQHSPTVGTLHLRPSQLARWLQQLDSSCRPDVLVWMLLV